MIAIVTSSGAFLYDLTVKQADELCKTNNYAYSKEIIGWLFHNPELPYRLQSLGIMTCYIDLKSIDDKRKNNFFCKVSIHYLIEIWEKVFKIHEFLVTEKCDSLESEAQNDS